MRPVTLSHLLVVWKWFYFVFLFYTVGHLEFKKKNHFWGSPRKELGLKMIIACCLYLKLLCVLSSDLYFLSFTSITRLSIIVFTTMASLLCYFCVTVSQWERIWNKAGMRETYYQTTFFLSFPGANLNETQREKEVEELPNTDNRRKEVRRWEQVPKASWGENEKKPEICHLHWYHFLLYFKSEDFFMEEVVTLLYRGWKKAHLSLNAPVPHWILSLFP